MVPDILLSYFAANPMPTMWSVDRALEGSPVRETLQKYLEAIDHTLIEVKMTEPMFLFFNERVETPKRIHRARIEIFREEIESEITSLRLSRLRSRTGDDRPFPYDHPALQGTKLDCNGLVDLNRMLDPHGRRLLKNGFEFCVCLSLPGLNSMAWVEDVLLGLPGDSRRLVRLDPLLIQPTDGVSGMKHKMWVYGTTLGWEEIATLSEPAHGRWMPHPLTTGAVAFTDYVWDPRGNEVHFICEEVPQESAIYSRGSRYFHSIYLPETNTFRHIDGAVRLYDKDAITARLATHVRNAGKVGERLKLFQVDGEIHEEHWSALANAFFIWNQDVWNYLAPNPESRIPASWN